MNACKQVTKEENQKEKELTSHFFLLPLDSNQPAQSNRDFNSKITLTTPITNRYNKSDNNRINNKPLQ